MSEGAVPRRWPGATVVVVAGGPSLTAGQVDACRGRARVVAVNNAWELCPWADLLYACDGEWWAHYRPPFAGARWSQVNLDNAKTQARDRDKARLYGCRLVGSRNRPGLSRDRAVVHQGSNGGYQAVNLAYHLGARRLVLLGFDFRLGPGGRQHWHGDHPRALGAPKAPDFFTAHAWIDKFHVLAADLAAAGVEVVNASPDSALTKVAHANLADALRGAAS